jgi:uncharacterized protein YcfL
MKKLFLVVLSCSLLFSCKTTKQVSCDAYSQAVYSDSTEIEKTTKEFLMLSDEEKKFFFENFVFSTEELESEIGIILD